MVVLNTYAEETRDPNGFDHDRVVWDADYRREVIERLKRADSGERADARPSYN